LQGNKFCFLGKKFDLWYNVSWVGRQKNTKIPSFSDVYGTGFLRTQTPESVLNDRVLKQAPEWLGL
jgi:hypothetical protein